MKASSRRRRPLACSGTLRAERAVVGTERIRSRISWSSVAEGRAEVIASRSNRFSRRWVAEGQVTSGRSNTGECDVQADRGVQAICPGSSETLGHFPSVEIFDQLKANVHQIVRDLLGIEPG